MKPAISRWVVVVLTATLLPAAAARADFLPTLARGLSLLDTRFAFERNVLGDGWTVNTQAFYNNRTFHLGLADLTLSGVVSTSAGYTLRGLPSGFVQINSGSLGAPTSLSYSFDAFNGVNNFTATGSALVNIDTRVNALGFYDMTLQISNRGTFITDAVTGETDGNINFDVGPIVIRGNIFADILGAVTDPFFAAAGAENPFRALNGTAAKAAELMSTVDSLTARLKAGDSLSSEEYGKLINNSIIASMLGIKPSGKLFEGLFPKELIEANAKLALDELQLAAVPEPGSLSLLGLGLPLVWRRRRAA